MNTWKQSANKEMNLVPGHILLYVKLKFVQNIAVVCAALILAALSTHAVVGYVRLNTLNNEITEDKKIIEEGRLDELNALKEQYDNLILGIDSGNITLIPAIETKMTELFEIINRHKPAAAELTGVDGQLKSSGEYTYRLEYSSTDRAVVSGFLEKLQAEKLEYINISSITKSVVDETVNWLFSITVKLGGIER